jgi:hypothetical protein
VDLNFIFQIIVQVFNLNVIGICPFFSVLMIVWFSINSPTLEVLNLILALAGAISLTSELLIIVSLFLLICFLPIAFHSSDVFAKVGIYHPLSNFNSPFGETLKTKIWKVYVLNLQLSLLIFILIFFFVVTIIQFKEPLTSTDLFNLIASAIAICPAFLLSLRLLSNPVRITPQFQGILRFLNWFFSISFLARPHENSHTIKMIKERFVSLYFSMIATVLFTLIFLYVYLALIHGTEIFNYVGNLFVPQFLELNLLSIVALGGVFLVVLFVTTAAGERFLRYHEVIEIDHVIIDETPLFRSFMKIIELFRR